jgi:hypothetical protein
VHRFGQQKRSHGRRHFFRTCRDGVTYADAVITAMLGVSTDVWHVNVCRRSRIIICDVVVSVLSGTAACAACVARGRRGDGCMRKMRTRALDRTLLSVWCWQSPLDRALLSVWCWQSPLDRALLSVWCWQSPSVRTAHRPNQCDHTV